MSRWELASCSAFDSESSRHRERAAIRVHSAGSRVASPYGTFAGRLDRACSRSRVDHDGPHVTEASPDPVGLPRGWPPLPARCRPRRLTVVSTRARQPPGAEIKIGGRSIAVSAENPTDDERASLPLRVRYETASFRDAERRTDRGVPLFGLTPVRRDRQAPDSRPCLPQCTCSTRTQLAWSEGFP